MSCDWLAHVWEQHRALEAHVVADFENLKRIEQIQAARRGVFAGRFEIGHCTLEFETPDAATTGAGQHPQDLIPPH